MVQGEIGQTDTYLSYSFSNATRGKHPNWLLGGVFPTTYILGGDEVECQVL